LDEERRAEADGRRARLIEVPAALATHAPLPQLLFAAMPHGALPTGMGGRTFEEQQMKRFLIVAALAAFSMPASGIAGAQEVGKVGVDWTGNDIIVEAVKDPKVEGVVCHVAYFDRSIIDRLHKGNWFEDPSNSAISCSQTGPITIGDIDTSKDGEEVFKQGLSLIWKKQVVNRIYDKANNTLVYLSHSRQVQNGSAKMAISTVPLYGQQVTWKEPPK
jgi:CreA protein